MTVKFWGQHEIREEYQAIFWYIFLVEDTLGESVDLINEFIHSNYFTDFCLPFIVKKYTGENYRFLQRAFNRDVLDLSFFRSFNKKELKNFFEEYAGSASWGDDRNAFVTLIKRFNDIFNSEVGDQFFLISKEWFTSGDKILNADSEFYIYYFLIVWFETDKKVINICELNYD